MFQGCCFWPLEQIQSLIQAKSCNQDLLLLSKPYELAAPFPLPTDTAGARAISVNTSPWICELAEHFPLPNDTAGARAISFNMLPKTTCETFTLQSSSSTSKPESGASMDEPVSSFTSCPGGFSGLGNVTSASLLRFGLLQPLLHTAASATALTYPGGSIQTSPTVAANS